MSVGQDIVYISSEGKKLTPKHVGLSMSLLHLIRSQTILTMLSRQGHCVSYDEAGRIDTEWAKNQVAESSDAKTFGQLSDFLLNLVLQKFSTSCSLMSVVCDRYDCKNSIKSEERPRRSRSLMQEIQVRNRMTPIPKQRRRFFQTVKIKKKLC